MAMTSSDMGKKGGRVTVERHGKEHMKEISKKGVEARKRNKMAKLGQ